ncbi:hypothetical protein [uncultured Chryseobacterium sp.]|uniref:hypothetical protein n=1 Tax=uncultured Chryseobacterium sp. TaxID=259322 RepID=UPI0025E27403|nr:hypothetical protein [uncultured Chryseobacterium sp.]
MKTNVFLAIAFFFSLAVRGQVGINNQSPKATLDITAKTTDGSRPEGVIIPRLTGNQIQSGNAQYGSDQKGIIIYATAAVSSPDTKTANITAEGYYYFDGSIWKKITGGGASSGSWSTTGSSGIDPSVNFIGSTNAGGHLMFKVGGHRAGIVMDSMSAGNTAIGFGAINLKSNAHKTTGENTAFGYEALRSITGNSSGGGGGNTAFGYQALSGNTTGSENTAIGRFAGANITTGSKNIVIGTGQNVTSVSGSNQLNIGGAIFGTGLSGNAAAPAGNIGIGTAAPASKLEINGAATNTSAYNAGSSTTIDFSKSNLAFTSASAGNFTLQNIKDGGTYTLNVRGATSGTSAFTATGFTFKYVNNNATIANTETLYTFVTISSTVYVYCARGL